MEKPQTTIYINDGQTKITLIGMWFHMTAKEIEDDYERKLQNKDPLIENINQVLLEVLFDE